MLVLSRKIGQRIRISEEIELTVLNIRGPQVRLGITAPRAIEVRRAELPRSEPPQRTTLEDSEAGPQ